MGLNMSGQHIKPTIEKFLKESLNGALLIRGRWGVGKTYFWRQTVKEAKERKILSRPYAYVSLFGLNSLDEIKESILISFADPAKEKQNWLDRSWRGSKRLAPYLKEWLRVPLAVAFPMVRNSLICIDDIERRGKELHISTAIGLVSMLKEELDCKVVMISNDAALEEVYAEEFSSGAEKVFDYEVEFALSAEEAFHCVFINRGRQSDKIQEKCIKLGITNLRIIQRIARLWETLEPTTADLREELIDGVIHSLVLFVWSHNETPGLAPPLDYLRDLTPFRELDRKEKGDRETQWDFLLLKYGYRITDEIDHELIKGVQLGYFDYIELRRLLAIRDRELGTNARREDYQRAWERCVGSFDSDEEAVVSDLVKSFRENMALLPVGNLEDVVFLLRQLGRDELANSTIDQYLASHQSLGRRDQVLLRRSDEYLASKIEEMNDREQPPQTFEAVMAQIAQGSWSPREEDFLHSRTTDEYYSYFRREKPERLPQYVFRLLQFASNEGRYREIGMKAREALLRLGAESKLNSFRVSEIYGIKSQEDE
jgi:hypothetical protein